MVKYYSIESKAVAKLCKGEDLEFFLSDEPLRVPGIKCAWELTLDPTKLQESDYLSFQEDIGGAGRLRHFCRVVSHLTLNFLELCVK